MPLSSLALWVVVVVVGGVWGEAGKMHEERGRRRERKMRETKKNKWGNRCQAGLADPLSAKETQQQIAEPHC